MAARLATATMDGVKHSSFFARDSFLAATSVVVGVESCAGTINDALLRDAVF